MMIQNVSLISILLSLSFKGVESLSSTLRGVESTTCQENLCKPCNNTEFLTCCDSSNSCVYDSVFNEYICIPPYKWICASENQAELEMKGCENGISCDQVEANGFTFDCRFAGDADSGVPALMLHGFPEWSDMYMDLMRRLAKEGFRSAACNMRGYSPGAKPKGVEDYDYDVLASDVEAISENLWIERHEFELDWTRSWCGLRLVCRCERMG